MPTPDEIRESELGDKAKILGCCLRRSPSSDVWAADYGCFLVYETPDCSGEFRRFENLDQVEDFLLKRNSPAPESPADQGFEAMLIPPPLAEGESQKSIGRKVFPRICGDTIVPIKRGIFGFAGLHPHRPGGNRRDVAAFP